MTTEGDGEVKREAVEAGAGGAGGAMQDGWPTLAASLSRGLNRRCSKPSRVSRRLQAMRLADPRRGSLTDGLSGR